MAISGGVWGIDIGQCALKALRCTAGSGDTVVADAFDYIEYPKILNQPEADPKAMVQEALQQFLSRNKVKGDKVAVSVSGQSGLARFFKPPPVDAKKMPDLVKFEARQQIPFALEDVIWDWQLLGGTEVDGFTLDSEVGLFAMKRDAVFRALEPFDVAEIETDIVQLAPEAVFNYVAHDLIADMGAGDNYDSENPPPSFAVLSMGTDTSDLIVTNGYRLWQRSIPIGGNHFTKQLSKELKLTFAKAEHLKRNARQAEDPKAIFQAMRGTFNDMVTEVQRSLSFFQTVDRKAKIKGLVLLGNAVKLPGLSQYLSKNLGLEIVNVDGFDKLTGAGVVSSPSFKDNSLSFGVCYGLCLQGLGAGKLRTNLVPRELITERMIRAKKPWALASYAGLLLACSFNFFFHYTAWSGVHPKLWDQEISTVAGVKGNSTTLAADYKAKQTELERVKNIGEELVGNVDRRLLWLELLKAISESLPTTDYSTLNGKKTDIAAGTIPDHTQYPIDLRREIHVEYIEAEYFPDLATWYANPEVKRLYGEEQLVASGEIAADTVPTTPPATGQAAPMGQTAPPMGQTAPPMGQTAPPMGQTAPPMAQTPPPMGQTAPAGQTPATGTAPATGATAAALAVADADPGPKGPGWIIEIRGHHFYNRMRATEGVVHLRKTFIQNLQSGKVTLPIEFGNGPGSPTKFDDFTMKELGIGYVLVADSEPIDPFFEIANPDYIDPQNVDDVGRDKKLPAADDPNNKPAWRLPKYSFVIQFVWKEKLLRDRLKERKDKELQAQLDAEKAAAAAQNPAAATTTPPAPPATK